MRLTNVDQASCLVATVDGMWTALLAMSAEGLPPAHDVAQAAALFDDRLLRHGIDVSNAGCRLLFQWVDPEGIEDRRLTALRWAVHVHACIPRRHADPIEALEGGLRLVERHLRPFPGMRSYLDERAKELAAQEIRFSRVEPARLKPALAHAWSMDDPHTVRLPFSVTLPVSEAFDALRDDGVALYRVGHRMGACPLYRTALLRSRELVAPGVAAGIYSLPEQPCFENIEPAAYIEHFRCVIDDRKWIDAVLMRLGGGEDATRSRRIEFDALPWLIALSRLGGWTPVRLERLLARDDLFADHPDQFLSAAMNAIEHVARRDAAAEVCAALTLLSMVRDQADARSDLLASATLRRCRRWVAGLRRGRDLLWLNDHLQRLAGYDLAARAKDETWPKSVSRRLADDRALARGAVLFLLGIRDPRLFARMAPLIEGILSLRDEFRLLWKLARGEDRRLMRRAGMFMLGLLSGRIDSVNL